MPSVSTAKTVDSIQKKAVPAKTKKEDNTCALQHVLATSRLPNNAFGLSALEQTHVQAFDWNHTFTKRNHEM